MKILVTGGNGFIGSKIVEMLSLKNSITVLINKLAKRNEVKKINGYRRNIELKN